MSKFKHKMNGGFSRKELEEASGKLSMPLREGKRGEIMRVKKPHERREKSSGDGFPNRRGSRMNSIEKFDP